MKLVYRKIAFGNGDFNLLIYINAFWHLPKVESSSVMILGGFLQVLFSFHQLFYNYLYFFFHQTIKQCEGW